MTVATDACTGVNGVEACAARRTPQNRSAQSRAGQRAEATGTPVAVGVDSPAVPDRYLAFPEFALDRRAWEALQIPVGLAFFFHNSTLGRTVAFYPGPAGATESELDLQAWNDIRTTDPRVDTIADDTEALLVRVPDDETASPHAYLVPIDACYEFVGRLRMMWRGFDGGQDVRNYIDEFFELLDSRSRVVDRA